MVHNENPPSEPLGESERPVEATFVPNPNQEDESERHGDRGASSTIVTAQLVLEDSGNGGVELRQPNLAATGGAIASVVLGAWSIIGATVTAYSVINAFLGLALGCWGVSSGVRWPWLGIALSIVGIVSCAVVAAGR